MSKIPSLDGAYRLKVRWTRRAHQQLQDALAFVAQDNPIAASKIAERIYTAERLLAGNPTQGRPGRIADTRE